MKKLLLLIFFSTLFNNASIACDICGCGVGNTYVGILPEFRKHIFGLRYRYNSLITHVGIGGSVTYLTTNEYYKNLELWGAFSLHKKIKLQASIPFTFNQKTNQDISHYKNGIGDASIIAFYELLNKRNSLQNKILIHNLWIGGGFKLPTGKYNPIDKGTNNNTNLFQSGTGSFDFSLNGMYDLRYQDVGINIAANIKMNTQNQYQYQYGNKFTLSSQLYYKFKIANSLSLVPNVGLIYETAQKDIDNNIIADISGGNLTMGSIGIETAYKKMALGINWQTPVQQNLANGIIKANNRSMLHISFLL